MVGLQVAEGGGGQRKANAAGFGHCSPHPAPLGELVEGSVAELRYWAEWSVTSASEDGTSKRRAAAVMDLFARLGAVEAEYADLEVEYEAALGESVRMARFLHWLRGLMQPLQAGQLSSDLIREIDARWPE